jgi:hypothetical protein
LQWTTFIVDSNGGNFIHEDQEEVARIQAVELQRLHRELIAAARMSTGGVVASPTLDIERALHSSSSALATLAV